MRASLISLLLPALAIVSAWHTGNHDSIAQIPEAFGEWDNYIRTLQPWLANYLECDSYPAVDSEGRVGLGLKPKGGGRSGCTTDRGQVYARAGTVASGHTGVMFGWYFPKQEGVSYGRRHAWMFIVVWLKDYPNDQSPLQVSSVYGEDWLKSDAFVLKQGRVIAVHDFSGIHSLSNSELRFISDDNLAQAKFQPLIDWNMLPAPAKDALDHYNWGFEPEAQVLMNEFHFNSQMEKAWAAELVR